MPEPEKKRTWQSYKSENEELRAILWNLFDHCPRCGGSGQSVNKEDGKVYGCPYCSTAAIRFEQATGERLRRPR